MLATSRLSRPRKREKRSCAASPASATWPTRPLVSSAPSTRASCKARIWPSGAMISQTGGHGDFRLPYEVPASPNAPLSRVEAIGGGAIADGVDRVLKRAREQLMLGASQLKFAAGGGVSSHYDPIDVSQYTEAEFRAAVDAAENWCTYVAVHAYTPRAIETAIRGGVKCIEHGHLMDEASAELIAQNGIWLSTQPFLNNEYSSSQPTAEGEAKA